MAAWKLAAGNTCVLKPAETDKHHRAEFGRDFSVRTAGWRVNIVTGAGETGRSLVEFFVGIACAILAPYLSLA